jgi:hypothetical protein
MPAPQLTATTPASPPANPAAPRPDRSLLRGLYLIRWLIILTALAAFVAGAIRVMDRAANQNFAGGAPVGDYLAGVGWYILVGVGLLLLALISYLKETPEEEARRTRRTRQIRTVINTASDPLIMAGMYSSDPVTARRNALMYAQRELQRERENRAAVAHTQLMSQMAQRAQDQADEERRMRLLAKAMVDEMEQRVESRKSAGHS